MKKTILIFCFYILLSSQSFGQDSIKLYFIDMTGTYYGNIPMDSILSFSNLTIKTLADSDTKILATSLLKLKIMQKSSQAFSFDHRIRIDIWKGDRVYKKFYMSPSGLIRDKNYIYNKSPLALKILEKYIPDLKLLQKNQD